ncbi:Srp21 [Kluyveromyces lactis]|nr:Srp21 [Kluyveromyces lactis]
MSVSDLDTFITGSLRLLETNASQTKITMKYRPQSDDIHSKVTFRTKNDSLGLVYKYKTAHSKELSRGLSAVGPTGVNLQLGKVGKQVFKKKSKDLPGMTTLLVNQKVKPYVEPVKTKVSAPTTAASNTVSGKNGKKKNKKGKK